MDIKGTAVKLLGTNSHPSPYNLTPFGSIACLNTNSLPTPPTCQSTPVLEASGAHVDIPQVPASTNECIPDILNVELHSYSDSNESLADFEAGNQESFLFRKNSSKQDRRHIGVSEDMMSDELMLTTAGEALSAPRAELAPETTTQHQQEPVVLGLVVILVVQVCELGPHLQELDLNSDPDSDLDFDLDFDLQDSVHLGYQGLGHLEHPSLI